MSLELDGVESASQGSKVDELRCRLEMMLAAGSSEEPSEDLPLARAGSLVGSEVPSCSSSYQTAGAPTPSRRERCVRFADEVTVFPSPHQQHGKHPSKVATLCQNACHRLGAALAAAAHAVDGHHLPHIHLPHRAKGGKGGAAEQRGGGAAVGAGGSSSAAGAAADMDAERKVDKLRNHLEGLLARTSAESDSVYSAATISADAVLILQQSIGHEVKQPTPAAAWQSDVGAPLRDGTPGVPA